MKRCIVWVALVAGCASRASLPKEGEVRLEIVGVTPESAFEGDTGEAHYRIVNGSKGMVVIGQGEPRYGNVYRAGADRVIYDTLAQSASRPVFYTRSQFIRPGEEVMQSLRQDLFAPEVRVEVQVWVHDTPSVEVWVPKGKGTDPMHEEFVRGSLDQLSGGDIIFFGGGREEKLSATHPVTPKERDFSLADARSRLGVDAHTARWSTGLGAWVLVSDVRTVIVKPDGLTDLPKGSLPVVLDYDAAAEKFSFRLGTTTELQKGFATREGDGMYTVGTFVDVPRDRLLETLCAAHREGLTVKKVFYYFSSYYFEFAR